jgi:hypothetical protein
VVWCVTVWYGARPVGWCSGWDSERCMVWLRAGSAQAGCHCMHGTGMLDATLVVVLYLASGFCPWASACWPSYRRARSTWCCRSSVRVPLNQLITPLLPRSRRPRYTIKENILGSFPDRKPPARLLQSRMHGRAEIRDRGPGHRNHTIVKLETLSPSGVSSTRSLDLPVQPPKETGRRLKIGRSGVGRGVEIRYSRSITSREVFWDFRLKDLV